MLGTIHRNRPFLTIGSLLAASLLGGCKSDPQVGETRTLRYLNAPSTITLPELGKELGFLDSIQLVSRGSTFSGPQDIQTVVSKDIDFGGAFNGAIVKLVASKAPVKAVISYYGVDSTTWTGYYVKENSPIRTPRDLIGKKIALNTLGAHHEFMVREWLRRGGLTEKEIGQVSLIPTPPVQTEHILRSGQVDAAALGGIVRDRALGQGGIRPIFKDRDLYGDFSAGALVFRKEFLEKNPGTVRLFVQGLGKTIDWVNSHPRDTVIARLHATARHLGRSDTALLDYWKSSGLPSLHGGIEDRDFQTWIDFLKRQGDAGGELKPSDIYTNEFQAAKP